MAEVAARSGFDYLIVDGEHGDRAADLNGLYRAIAPFCSPVYRASRLDPDEIGHACDLGFEAVLVPNAEASKRRSHAYSPRAILRRKRAYQPRP